MRSMTGFGVQEYISDELRMSIELKAYNNKYLDISINMPPFLSIFENKIRDIIKSKGITRGRVEVNIRLKELKENLNVIIDDSIVSEVVKGLREVAIRANIEPDIKLSDIMAFEGVVKTDKERNLDSFWEIIQVELEKVVDQFILEKIREGHALRNDIFSALDSISKNVELIQSFVPEIESKIKKNFVEKFREVLGDEIDENRILTELGLLLVKYDINEEIVRLRSHIENFRDSSQDISSGKKLDFICQEMNREINTIGSKSPLLEISRIVVDLKNSLEQIREQARNVE